MERMGTHRNNLRERERGVVEYSKIRLEAGLRPANRPRGRVRVDLEAERGEGRGAKIWNVNQGHGTCRNVYGTCRNVSQIAI